MKKIVLFPSILLYLVINSQNQAMTLQSKNIKGRVVSFTEKTFQTAKNSKEFTPKNVHTYVFDKKGYLRHINNLNDDAKVVSKEIYSYQSKKLTKIAKVNSTGKTNQTIVYEYDEMGNLSFEKKYNNQSKLQYEIKYFYHNGQLISIHKLIPSIDYTLKENFKYNNKNELIEHSKTARLGTSRKLFKYNNKGLLTKTSEYNTMGELFKVTIYTYNEQNDLTNFKQHNTDQVLIYSEKYAYLYDKNNNWLEKIHYKNGKKYRKDIRDVNYY